MDVSYSIAKEKLWRLAGGSNCGGHIYSLELQKRFYSRELMHERNWGLNWCSCDAAGGGGGGGGGENEQDDALS